MNTHPEWPSQTFCILPFLHLFVDERGMLYPCCRSVDTLRPNVDGRRKPLRIYDPEPLETAWNSQYMKQLRRDLVAGRRPAPCRRCYAYEDLGVKSHRQSANPENHHHLAGILNRLRDDGSLPLDLKSVDIRLGNHCNLRCRMCSPTSTKALIGEWKKLHGWDESHPYIAEVRHLDWYAQEEFWRSLEGHAENVERLHFAGGEPLLIDSMFRFLERLVTAGASRRITLSYNTNLTLLPPQVFDLWPRFAGVKVTVSVDGHGEVNSFIRYPSDWQTLDRNLVCLDNNARRLNCSDLSFNTTVQVYNVLRLTELLDYTLARFQKFEPVPNLSLLSQPSCFSIQALSPELKSVAARRLRTWLEKTRARPPERLSPRWLGKVESRIEGIVRHMEQRDRSWEIAEFQRRNGVHDQARKQRLLDVLPELEPLMKARQGESTHG